MPILYPAPTFGTMQQQGLARPPAPVSTSAQTGQPTMYIAPPVSGTTTANTRVGTSATVSATQPQSPLTNQYLWNQYSGFKQPQGFNYQQQQRPQMPQAFSYSPFDYGQSQQQPFNYGQSQQQPFNYGQLQQQQTQQYSAIGGPQQTTQGPGNFQAQGTPFQSQLEETLGQSLANPSAYGSENVASQYDVLNRRLGQDFDVQRQKINEDMARRGLHSSTVAGGRLGDLATNQAQAQTDMATNLMNQSAARYGQDRQSAIAQAMGYGGLNFGNQLAGYQANLAGSNQAFNQDLATRAFQGDQQAMEVLNSLQRGQFNMGQQQQGFNQAAQGYGMNQAGQQQGFNQALQGYGMNQAGQQQGFNQAAQSYGMNQAGQQQNFGQQMDSANFQQGMNQQDFQNALMGFGANQGANQQGFNQQQQLLQNLMGNQQNQFGNWATTEGLRQSGDQFNQFMPFLMQLLGYGTGGGQPGGLPQGGGQPPGPLPYSDYQNEDEETWNDYEPGN